MGDLNPFGMYLDKMVEDINARRINDGDYIGEDGLLYCKKCHTPRQAIVNWYDGSKKEVPISCQCSEEKKRKEQNSRTIEELIKKSGIEPKYLKCTFDSITVNESNKWTVSVCKRYVNKFQELYKQNQGMMFYGSTGTGKTVMAHCVANELINRLHSVASISLAKILGLGVKNQEEEADIMKKIRSAELLIIDDLGAERGTDYAQEFVFNVIDTRCNCEKPMIITTNLDLQDMQNCTEMKYKRIYERIIDTCYPIEFKGPSWRMKNAAERYDKFTDMLGGCD